MVALGPQQETAVTLVSRTGRHLQRYVKGRRQVVGCIPYRYRTGKKSSLEIEELEVLLISSQKGKGMLFPKGGWESDETKKQAALRETYEEAGVRGIVQSELGKWSFRSRSHDAVYEGYMFPLLVLEQLDLWPEKNLRQRKWVSVAEARESCQHLWMKEALDKLVNRLMTQQQLEEEVGPCPIQYHSKSNLQLFSNHTRDLLIKTKFILLAAKELQATSAVQTERENV